MLREPEENMRMWVMLMAVGCHLVVDLAITWFWLAAVVLCTPCF